MKLRLLFICLLTSAKLLANPGDTTHIRVHDKTDMTWFGNYDQKALFPSNTTWRKVLMVYTMGCASTGCSGWDYTTHIQLLKKTGALDSNVVKIDTVSQSPLVIDTTWNVFEVKESWELGRVITPYGTYMAAGSNGYDNSWTFPHYFDVTDYASLLHDSVELRAFYSGWSSGFSVTLDFYFIEGTPPREVLSMENLWGKGGGSFGYSNSADFEKNALPALTVTIPSGTESTRLRFIPSGHGFDNNQYAAEFKPCEYWVLLDNNQVGSGTIWNDQCGKNPIWPQGGTWIYNRANWCPGLRVGELEHELGALSSGQHSLDINFEDYSWSGNQGPGYTISTVLFSYGKWTQANDVSLLDIMQPSTDKRFVRMNPSCNGAMVNVQNLGGNDITSLDFEYGLANGTAKTWTWTGTIKPYQYLAITLPEFDRHGAVNGDVFRARIAKVNGQTDGYEQDNVLESRINYTPTVPSKLILNFKTNSAPDESSYTITDASGNVVKSSGTIPADYNLKDTIQLAAFGCYELTISDAGGDGINWWANSAQVGTGFVRLLNGNNGKIVKVFQGDFGSEIKYQFNVNQPMGLTTPELDAEFAIYPNPGRDEVYITLPEHATTLAIYSADGRLVESVSGNQLRSDLHLTTTHLDAGVYVMQVITESGVSVKKWIKQ